MNTNFTREPAFYKRLSTWIMSKSHYCPICLLYMIHGWECLSVEIDHFSTRLWNMEHCVIVRVMLIICLMSIHIFDPGVDAKLSVDIREELHQVKVFNDIISFFFFDVTNFNVIIQLYRLHMDQSIMYTCNSCLLYHNRTTTKHHIIYFIATELWCTMFNDKNFGLNHSNNLSRKVLSHLCTCQSRLIKC